MLPLQIAKCLTLNDFVEGEKNLWNFSNGTQGSDSIWTSARKRENYLRREMTDGKLAEIEILPVSLRNIRPSQWISNNRCECLNTCGQTLDDIAYQTRIHHHVILEFIVASAIGNGCAANNSFCEHLAMLSVDRQDVGELQTGFN